MKYVDDLTKVKPEEIKHKYSNMKIESITHCPKASELSSKIVVVWENGSSASYTIDGKPYAGNPPQMFVYKPKKVKKLKPLHQVLAESPGYEIKEDDFCGVYIETKSDLKIMADMLTSFGKSTWNTAYSYDESWFEEVEE